MLLLEEARSTIQQRNNSGRNLLFSEIIVFRYVRLDDDGDVARRRDFRREVAAAAQVVQPLIDPR